VFKYLFASKLLEFINNISQERVVFEKENGRASPKICFERNHSQNETQNNLPSHSVGNKKV